MRPSLRPPRATAAARRATRSASPSSRCGGCWRRSRSRASCCATSTAASWTSPRSWTAARCTSAGSWARTTSPTGMTSSPVTVAASRSTELFTRFPRQLWRDLRGLGGNERIAVIGVAIMVGSLLLPWYEAPDPFNNDLVLTGFGAFSFAEAALLLVAGATVFLALEGGGGYIPPRPLREWGLFVALGAWAAVIVVYRMFDRPSFEL